MKTSRRCSLASIAAVAAFAVAAPSPADAASGRFYAYVKGTQVTTWDEPEHLVRVDCNSHDYRKANGKETTTFRSVRPLVVTVHATGGQALVAYGKPTSGLTGIPALGRVERSAAIDDRRAAASCTRDLQQPPKPNLDCGTRQLSVDATVNWVKPGRAELSLTESLIAPLGGKEGFDTCPLELPLPGPMDPAPASGGDLTKAEAKVSAASLLRTEVGKTKVITATDRISSTVSGPFDSRVTSTQTVRWQVRLLRLKGR